MTTAGGSLTAHDGGRSLSDEQLDSEWRDAWAGIADACERGLRGLHRLHPRRDDLLALARDARLAAGLPGEPHLTLKETTR